MVIALALMTGLQGELRDRILGSQSHIFVYKDSGIDHYDDDVAKAGEVPGVVGAAPAIMGKALVSTDRADAFISLKGIDPALEPTVTDIRGAMRSGVAGGLDPRRGRAGRVSCWARAWRDSSASRSATR